MPSRTVQVRLDDMVEEITGIRALLQGVSFEAYRETWSLRRATERGLEIISEASRAIPQNSRHYNLIYRGGRLPVSGTCCATNINMLIRLSYGTLSSGTWSRWKRRFKYSRCISAISARSDPTMTPIAPRQQVADRFFEHHRCQGANHANL